MLLRRIKISISSSIKAVLFYCGFFHLLRVVFPNKKVSVLRYHAVVDRDKNFYTSPSISLSVREFERHVRYFAKRYRILALDEVIDKIQTGQALPPNSVVFTFDDGYADNFVAAEILEKYGGTAIFYLTTDCIDRKEPLWLVEVNYLIERAHRDSLELKVNGSTTHLSLTTAADREKAKRHVIRTIKSNNRSVRESVRRQLREQIAHEDWQVVSDKVMLNWDQVKKMISMGMSVGGHTLSHLNLPNADPQDTYREIDGCRKVLQERLGIPIRHFSVPNSGPYEYYNDAVKKAVGDCGFLTSVVSAHGFVDQNCDLLELRRIRTVPALHEVVATIELGKFST